MDESQELINEFLIESNENLSRLDQEFVELEQRPGDKNLLSSIFRTIHTIKGTCGFLGFSVLEGITHRAENILSQLRDGQRDLTPGITTLLLETVDAVKKVLREIEASGSEGSEEYSRLRERLQAVCDGKDPGGSPRSGPPAPDASAGITAASHAPDAAPAAAPPEEAALEKPPLVAETVSTPAAVTPDSSASLEEETAEVARTPAETSKAEPETDTGSRRSVAESNIRVDVGLLDKLMNLVGELVLARNQILQYTSTQEDAAFTATSQRLNLITTELQANVMKTRMQPIGMVWNKFPRVVRDIGQSLGKQIDLEMEGAKTELDKTIIEAIKDPLTHIIRNSCDHGIETPEERQGSGKPSRGTLSLRAFHEGGQVNIEISDDGAGINPQRLKEKAIQSGLVSTDQAERKSDRELLQMIFLPGFPEPV